MEAIDAPYFGTSEPQSCQVEAGAFVAGLCDKCDSQGPALHRNLAEDWRFGQYCSPKGPRDPNMVYVGFLC